MKKFIGSVINGLFIVNKQKAVQLAYRLFASPRKGKYAKVPDFLAKAKGERLVVLGEEVQCYTCNLQDISKPLVLLVHGWESNAGRWEALQTYLGKDYRIVSFDAFALGQSTGKQLAVPDFSILIGTLIERYQPSCVIAHSLGAFSLLNYLAFNEAPHLEKVVLLGSLGKFNTILTYYFEMLGYAASLRLAIKAYLEQLTKRKITSFDCAEYVKNIQAKMLIIHDRQDAIIPLESCHAFHRAAIENNNQVMITENLGHSTQGEVVFKAVTSFL